MRNVKHKGEIVSAETEFKTFKLFYFFKLNFLERKGSGVGVWRVERETSITDLLFHPFMHIGCFLYVPQLESESETLAYRDDMLTN